MRSWVFSYYLVLPSLKTIRFHFPTQLPAMTFRYIMSDLWWLDAWVCIYPRARPHRVVSTHTKNIYSQWLLIKKRISSRNAPFDFNTLTVYVFIFTTPLYNIIYYMFIQLYIVLHILCGPVGVLPLWKNWISVSPSLSLSLSLSDTPSVCWTSLDKCIVTCIKAPAISFCQYGSLKLRIV